MSIPIRIQYQGLAPSPALSADIEAHAARLERFAPRLRACDVTVRRNERRRHRGNRYEVTVRASLPGAEFVAGRTCDANQSYQDAYVAAHEAMDAMRRQLEDFVRIRREVREDA